MNLVWKIGQRVLFWGLLGLMLVEGLPAATRFHRMLDDGIDPFVDVTGLWQFPWDLYAPEPDKVNWRLTAVFRYPDGSSREWESPRWESVSPAYKFRHFREINFFDRLRRDDNGEVWPAFARFLRREYGTREDGAGPAQVELWRHKVVIQPPGSGDDRMSEEESEKFYTLNQEGEL